jgi:hypothetical protein
MTRTLLTLSALTLLINGAAFGQSPAGQSLGDVARANREKQQAQESAGTLPKVITNQDLPANPPGTPPASASQPTTQVSGVDRSYSDRSSEQRFPDQHLAEQRGDQWRERIQEQENRVASLQARIDQLNASMHSTGSAQYEGPSNRYQALQMQRVAQMQEMLDQQKRRLYMMQEAARRAGMHTSIYDP